MLFTYYATYKRINIFKQEHVNWSLKNIIILYPKLVKDKFAFVFSSSRFPIGCLTFRYFRHYDQKSISRIVVDIKLLFSFFNCLIIILTVLQVWIIKYFPNRTSVEIFYNFEPKFYLFCQSKYKSRKLAWNFDFE